MKTAAFIVLGIVVGVGISGVTATAVKQTNQNEFCISCHEMEAHIYPGYQESSHYSNASAVQASCADCHVDKSSWPVMMVDKAKKGGWDIYQHLRGAIDTEEAYQARKEELVERVTARMVANDSAACRRCHNWEIVDLEAQEHRAKRAHEKMQPGETCVDCHKGVAHPSNKPTPEDEGGFSL